MTYGVQPTGFVRKPLSVILAEMEAQMVTVFGPGVIQSPQSPLGQLNGLLADQVAQLWELAEDVYQSYDPDQAEATRLETLARLRLITRSGDSDVDMRQALTNSGTARIDLQDITRAVRNVAGVEYAKVFVNDGSEIDDNGIPSHSVSVAVIGGEDDEIGAAIRANITPGVNTYGNHRIETTVDGYCRSFSIVRPIPVDVTLNVNIRVMLDNKGCPPPSVTAILNTLLEGWAAANENGKDVTAFNVRSIIEGAFSNVEVVSIEASRDDLEAQPSVDIAFIEISNLAEVSVEVVD
jgi:uncharacterized phage protein gp47/JayE